MQKCSTWIARLVRRKCTTSSQKLRGTSCVLLLLLTNQIQNYDRRRQKVPCQARSESHKAVISEECARKKLDRSEYYRRAARVDKKAQEIERAYMRPRRF